MDNLKDYVLWYKDLGFAEKPFCEGDSLVFCALSYMRFPHLDWRRPHKLRECVAALLAGDGIEIMSTDTDKTITDFIRVAADSHRFGDLWVCDYADEFYPVVPIQFSAITFILDDFTRYIAFRGTDSSIAGWKEDFMLSFTITPAQEMALAYLEEHVLPGQVYYVGGHSKGANLALYSACMLNEIQLDCIRQIWILDGPGLCKEVMDPETVRRIDAKSVMVQPEYDVIGKLFEPHITVRRIIRSSAKSLMQHSIFSWGIDHGEPSLTDAHDPKSVYISSILDRWMSTVSLEDRRTFTDELFAAMADTGADSLFDITAQGTNGFEKIIASLRDSSDETKDTLRKIRQAAYYETADNATALLKEQAERLRASADIAVAQVKEVYEAYKAAEVKKVEDTRAQIAAEKAEKAAAEAEERAVKAAERAVKATEKAARAAERSEQRAIERAKQNETPSGNTAPSGAPDPTESGIPTDYTDPMQDGIYQ